MKDITVSDIQVLWDKNQIDNEVSRIAKAIDDLMDTGETLLEVSQSVAKISDQEILTAVLLNKHGKRKHVIEPDYYCFSLDDKSWVVGYGMDYKGKFRGLNYVGTIFN